MDYKYRFSAPVPLGGVKFESSIPAKYLLHKIIK